MEHPRSECDAAEVRPRAAPPRATPLTDDPEPGPTESRLLEFFDAMAAAHAQAAVLAGGEERHFRIAGRSV